MVYIIFTNYEGSYYVECISELSLEELKEFFDIEKVLHDYDFRDVREELKNPTISDSAQFAVSSYVDN